MMKSYLVRGWSRFSTRVGCGQWPFWLLVLLPIAMQLPVLLGLRHVGPMPLVASVGITPRGGMGQPWLDPNVGFQGQALGRLAAEQWLAGKIPWWNSFGGVGLPLAAEVQPGALFLPFVLLYHFQSGWLIVKLLLEIIAGLCSFAFLRRIDLSPRAALIGAILFELNGTFAWHGPPITTPVCFLPMLLLGIEQLRARIVSSAPGGWLLIPVALAGSIYAGFPETAYINGLFTALWVLLRLEDLGGARAARFLGRLALAGSVGLACSLPQIVPFLEMLGRSFIGGHAGQFAHASLPAPSAALSLLPWLFGPIDGYNPASKVLSTVWGSIGGYLSAFQLLLAILGLLLARRRLALALGLWLLICLAKTYDIRPLSDLVNLIPMVSSAAFFRYCAPSWEFTAIIAIAVAFDRLEERSQSVPVLARLVSCAVAAFSVAAALLVTKHVLLTLHAQPGFDHYAIVAIGWCAISLMAGALALLYPRLRRHRLRILTLILALDAGLAFEMPIVTSAHTLKEQGGGIAFLQTHLGLQRFYTLGPVAPNYGAYFGVAQINYNYLPIPSDWVNYIHQNLDGGADAISFIGYNLNKSAGWSAAEEFRRNLSGYEEVGVKYVVASSVESPLLWEIDAPIARTRRVGPLPMENNLAVGLTIDAPPSNAPRWITQVSVLIGNYGYMANGVLNVELCTASGQCVDGHADIAKSVDNAPLVVPLRQPLYVPAQNASAPHTLRVTITQTQSTSPVALWLFALNGPPGGISASNLPPGQAPMVHLGYTLSPLPADSILPVYSGRDMTIYQLPASKPYFGLVSGACDLMPLSRTALSATCAAPSRLVRREAFYPGWHARIDGKAVPVSRVDDIFQSIAIPPGAHDITFFYTPSHSVLIMLGFVLGVLSLALGLAGEIRRCPRRALLCRR